MIDRTTDDSLHTVPATPGQWTSEQYATASASYAQRIPTPQRLIAMRNAVAFVGAGRNKPRRVFCREQLPGDLQKLAENPWTENYRDWPVAIGLPNAACSNFSSKGKHIQNSGPTRVSWSVQLEFHPFWMVFTDRIKELWSDQLLVHQNSS